MEAAASTSSGFNDKQMRLGDLKRGYEEAQLKKEPSFENAQDDQDESGDDDDDEDADKAKDGASSSNPTPKKPKVERWFDRDRAVTTALRKDSDLQVSIFTYTLLDFCCWSA